MDTTSFTVTPIGYVASALDDRSQAPKQAHEGAPQAWLEFDAAVGAGLTDIGVGDSVVVLTWLDRARRDVLRVHPRSDPTVPEHGVFSTRSPDRPNPIGLHLVEVVAVDGLRLQVNNLEAIDGTPILDVKPQIHAGSDG